VSEQIKSISGPRLSLNILGPEEIEKIHRSSLQVIESTGVRFPSKKALDIWRSQGAAVDEGSMIVKAPGRLIEEAIRRAPPVYTLAAGNPLLDLPLDGNHVYVGTDGCGVEVIDIRTGERRRSVLQDVADIARVADGLDEVGFHWVPVSAQDCPPQSRGLHELLAIWKNSTKHVQTESIYSETEARAALEMAALLAGGEEPLRRRPLLSIMECTVSPLAHDGGSLEAALVGAAGGLPVGFMSMASCASSGPATLAGNLVISNAEVLSGLALIQLAYPGAPVFYAAAQTVMDLRTGAYTGGGPEDFLFGAASNRLADFYRVPLSMGSFATGAKEPNWQAGLENTLSTFMASVAMSDMLLGVGLLNGSTVWSFSQMLMDCEIFGIVAKMMEGIPVDDETLAVEAIRDVGPGGTFLTHPHTKRHFRGLWRNSLLDRRPYGVWERDQDGAPDWALEKARRILAEHQPAPLDPRLEVELGRIITSVEKKYPVAF
jgi:trimethylamine--corrinoid protein Co-methyltransferase